MNEGGRDDWDPRDPSVLVDQRAAYDRMRETCPVAYSEFMGWSLFRHQDVVDVLEDPATYRSQSKHPAIPSGMDPPEHARYRAALAPHFDEAAMAALEPRSRDIAIELIEPIVAAGGAELMEAFATPFTLRTLCTYLGWREEQWECLGGWTHGNQQAAFSRDPAAGRALAKLLTEHVKANLEEHRSSADSDDVTCSLLATSVDGTPLEDDQIVSILRNWVAGEGTVAGGISLLVLYLAQHAELQERLRNEPSLIPAAVEEILRVDDPLVANRRTTAREVRIGDRTIPAGAALSLMWIAANRDSRAFDNASEVRLDRGTEDGLVWGRGIHLCLGAPMARLQMRIALEELLSRTTAFSVGGDVRRSVYPSDGLASFRLSVMADARN
ncbi:MAG TPA: cytochrome P450 [Candidatus Limnocylindria bacterium]|nr:cytochrome P450 [Candidatus Limnocylindria bacterium]